MTNFEERHFKDETVHLDFGRFTRCTFENCTLVFHGFGPFGAEHCDFGDSRWTFADAALTTLAMLSMLYAGGGGAEQLVERWFQDVREGKPIPKRPAAGH